MSTSDKLTYLNTTKTKIREGLNSLGADLDTEDTFRSYVDAIDEIYQDYPKITGEGESLSLDNTKQASMQIDYKGNTSQVSYSGKNIIDLATYSSKDSNVTLSFTDNNLLVSTSSGTYGKALYDVTNLFKANQGKKINVRYDSINLTSYTGTSSNTLIQIKRNSTNTTLLNAELTKTIYTIPSDIIDSDVFQIAIFGSGSSSNASSVTYNKLMFYFGEESASFEPYVGGTASPNPSYPQPINVVSGDNTIDICGKNLAQHMSGYIVTSTGVFKSSNDDCFYFPVVEGETYYCSSTGNRTIGAIYTSIPVAEQTCIQGTNINNVPKNGSFVASATGIMVVYANTPTSQSVKDTFMVVKGNTAPSTYEPYIGHSYLISLGSIELCKIGNYVDFIFKAINGNRYYDSLTQAQKDELTYGSWYLHKEIGKVVLNGSENWTYASNYPRFTSPYNGDLLVTSTLNNDVYSNCYKVGQTSNTNNTISFWTDGSNRQVIVHDERFTTKEQYNTWLSSNNVICYGRLYIPTNTPITDTTLINQLEEAKLSYISQTNISQVNNNLPFNLDVKALRGE